MRKIIPVILCGGTGTRLWPASRQSYPKQFMKLSGDLTMLQQTVMRVLNVHAMQSPIIVCNEEHRFIVAEQLREIGIKAPTILLEPVGKNTAPAVAVAALLTHQDDVLLVLPADHQIANNAVFHQALTDAIHAADDNKLVTFGINPEYPETGYGYIKRGNALDNVPGYHVECFVEKPDLEMAQQYVASNQYYWNSGMFMFQARHYLAELKRYHPDMVAGSELAIKHARRDLDFIRLDEAAYQAMSSDSIDYAVMEKTQLSVVIPLVDSGWSDMGSWESVYDKSPKDENNNVIHGHVVTTAVTNSYLQADSRLLAVVGVHDHIVVETSDAVLVAHKDAAQDVKQLVMQLKLTHADKVASHRMIYRPWGYYEVIDNDKQFQVKRITVKPGAKLSLQSHQHRAEHWVVISGAASVTRGDEVFELQANQSTYIPVQTKHRLENVGAEPLVIIEIQTGAYLGEDDIIRYEDRYGRDVASEVETVL